MEESTRECLRCGEVKPIKAFQPTQVNKTTGKQYYDLECKTCKSEGKRARYHSDPQFRALQVMYSMETGIKRNFPGAWQGSLAREGAAKLLGAKRCSYCQMPNDGSQAFALDHHIPLALGGLHTLENLWPSCEPCNRAKHDMPPTVFQAWMDALVFRLAWLRAQ